MKSSLKTIFVLALTIVFLSGFISGCSQDSENKQETTGQEHKSTTQVATQQKAENISAVLEEAAILPASEEIPSTPDWSQHITQFDQGWIAAEQPITIHFSHAVAAKDMVGQPIDGIVSITPQVEINAIFTATDELTLTHPERFQSGQTYSISLHPGKFEDIPDSLGAFSFKVQALKQDYELQISGLVPSRDHNSMDLKGTIRTTDTALQKDIEQTISLKQNKQDLPVTWLHNADKLSHEFTVSGIRRSDMVSQVTLQYSAQVIGVDKQSSHPIEVPPIDHFTVTAVRTIQDADKYIEVSFSEPLDRNQNLNGLVRLDGKNARLRVDGAHLRIYPSKKQSGVLDLAIEDTIKSARHIPLDKGFRKEITFLSRLPGIRFLSSGSIIPPSEQLTVPFEAINVKAVWVTAFKVYENNIQHFLQNNQINSSIQDQSLGRFLWKKKIQLPSVPHDQWGRYDIDMNEILANHSDGIINLTLSIDETTIAYTCPEKETLQEPESIENYEGPYMEEYQSHPYWYWQYYSTGNGYRVQTHFVAL